MVGYVQVHDEEYDPKEDQDHPDHRGYHQHRNRAFWSADKYTNDASIVARGDCTAHQSARRLRRLVSISARRPAGGLSACQLSAEYADLEASRGLPVWPAAPLC